MARRIVVEKKARELPKAPPVFCCIWVNPELDVNGSDELAHDEGGAIPDDADPQNWNQWRDKENIRHACSLEGDSLPNGGTHIEASGLLETSHFPGFQGKIWPFMVKALPSSAAGD